MAMIDAIKRMAIEAVDAANPVTIAYGTVTSTSPFEVLVDQRFTLPEEVLVIPEYASKLNLVNGDNVLMLRVQGGQNFVVLDRLVNP
ncbi:DUF2577 domain-containing protein [Paenibacillus taichungensis]|uniref:DUF2577 domain-containing protein n=1 Tax=Paenibacillus taichungensis TaxID=484184 RepID=UPI0038036172